MENDRGNELDLTQLKSGLKSKDHLRSQSSNGNQILANDLPLSGKRIIKGDKQQFISTRSIQLVTANFVQINFTLYSFAIQF